VYHSDDPRRSLTSPPTSGGSGAARAADLVDFTGADPSVNTVARTQNAAIEYTQGVAGEMFSCTGQEFEYAVLLPDPATSIRISYGGDEVFVEGFSVTFIPPGDSTVEVAAAGRLIRIIPVSEDGVSDKADNADSYAEPNPRVRGLEPWPGPADEWRVRSYSLDVPDEEGRFGRIFRSTTLMVNWLEITDGPRDPKRLSPHSHDDFEQCSLALEGSFVHHLRWPWTPDLSEWREDRHVVCDPPSVMIIPPGVIHTTQLTGRGRNVLVDIFCPPRSDFAEKSGWVINENDYRPPTGAAQPG